MDQLTAVHSASADALTGLTLSLFRVNNLMLAWGDRLVAPLGLTSARWQVLGAIVAAERPQPVAWLARDLGANRQNIQRIVNDLAGEGLVGFAPNPHHKRAQLVELTAKGRAAYDAAIALYRPRVEALAAGFSEEDLTTAGRVMLALRVRLESEAS
jgi:DNA-binding MarR family transcriptional regulator